MLELGGPICQPPGRPPLPRRPVGRPRMLHAAVTPVEPRGRPPVLRPGITAAACDAMEGTLLR